MAKKYDVVIIGAGPAGMTAALYASRANLSVMLLDRGIYGGQMNNTAEIENYPGFKSILGPDLSQEMYDSAIQFGADFGYGTVKSVTDQGDYKTIETDADNYETKAVIIATGSNYRDLGVPGEEEYRGRGVSNCAVCDGAFFRNQHVVVIGGGDSAVEEGEYLTRLVDKVTIIHRRDELRAQQIIQDRAFKNNKIDFIWDSNVQEITGDGNKVTGVKGINNKTGEPFAVDAGGTFIYVGIEPMSDPFRSLNITDDEGWFVTNEDMETPVPGIFAVGDIRKKHLRQVVTATNDGGIAGQKAYQYITELEAKTTAANV
ncbi:thioredoxin-disulfide reductase [Tetragenococcus koreensis]|uniref:thioredoxin-disulfide reductase n=1 Tax=Tetragenococcus koreensis TaxID=290335 RepID=UPI001F3E267E|nr:thioredoxin-disulfide reductase [Tetragenococcus koreensis]MCF1585659.1 thioredoxin-disulfide reductase [Tetragenococcus koreensis]MCF1615293.1 thioredoxin-disulfide reductase [Tetragenococcus koreensis]MCF1617429.1 thioredoxin-disulfide reductase [Tetragenococcus koreensis]MCF1620304.1 thioredoxin-disulfide reductase [Tetragenococcus koreensis]MCF1621778.1 thioredoxin-disulfide reductase [Tetragenococcus koreensis]